MAQCKLRSNIWAVCGASQVVQLRPFTSDTGENDIVLVQFKIRQVLSEFPFVRLELSSHITDVMDDLQALCLFSHFLFHFPSNPKIGGASSALVQ